MQFPDVNISILLLRGQNDVHYAWVFGLFGGFNGGMLQSPMFSSFAQVLFLILAPAYHGYFLSGPWQAAPGKRLLGELTLTPGDWHVRPRGYRAVVAQGKVGPDGKQFNGRIVRFPGCGASSFSRIAASNSLPPACASGLK
jgi:hypothetical protein